jgi:hypothetical protein
MGKRQGRNKSQVKGDHAAKTDHSERPDEIEADIRNRLEFGYYLE